MHVGSGSGRSLASLVKAGHPVVTLRLSDAYDVGGEFVRWEIATAVAGHLLGLNPFEEPSLHDAKAQTARILAEPGRRTAGSGPAHAIDDPELPAALWRALAQRPARRYVALAAYVAPNVKRTKLLTELRARIRRHFGVATMQGYGPRFLHSTGQLHKRGPAAVTVLQLTAEDPVDVPVPGAGYSFGALKAAQAAADSETLAAGGRPVIRVNLGRNVDRALERLVALLARRPKTAATKRRRTGTGRGAREPLPARAGRRR